MSMSKEYGYIRVSTKEQNENRQKDALEAIGILPENLYMDKQSGKDFNRPQYKKLVKKMTKGDCLFVKSIDRLGRNYSEIQEQWRILTKKKGIDIVVLDMPLLDTRKGKDLTGTLIADIVLQLLSYVAETERNMIHQRQMEGIAAALARGQRWGRPKRELDEHFKKWAKAYATNCVSLKRAAAAVGMHQSTFKYHFNKIKGDLEWKTDLLP